MNGFEQLRQENQALRDGNARLIAAILRISASLDVDTVLQEIVESARALTGARRGAITTIDERGEVQDFVTSGLRPEERRQMVEWPDRWRLFEHLRDLSAPMRVADLPGYLQSLGFSSNPWSSKTLQGTPMHHRGDHLGTLFLSDKDDGAEFTSEDEEVVALFAAQAATTIANARKHRDEQRARTDLETLVDISPVGLAVFDARTGNPVSFNRETTRIVESLRTPGQPPEHLLKVMTCRFADGREIALDELPLAEVLRDATPRRGEEVVMSVPDGRSVTTLVNAAPIHSKDGAVESVVVTIQDLAPLEEMERQRAEFLGLVSHELRAPLTSIKGSTTTVLAASPELDPAETREFFRIIDEQADHMRGLIGDLLDAGRIDSGTLSVAPEPSEVAALVERARNTFLSGGGRHAILIDLPSDLPLVLADRRRIVQVLNNLFANAARYSPQSLPHPDRGAARRRARRGLGRRRRPGGGPGTAAAPVQQARRRRRRGPDGALRVGGWPSARGWWRPTAAASGPRAVGRARARASPSAFRWPGRPRPAPPTVLRGRPRKGMSPRASWWSTMTRRRCASFATPSRRRAMPRS